MSRHVEWGLGELMANMGGVTNEIEGGDHDTWFFCSFFGEFFSFIIACDICEGSNFTDGVVVV